MEIIIRDLPTMGTPCKDTEIERTNGEREGENDNMHSTVSCERRKKRRISEITRRDIVSMTYSGQLTIITIR